MKGRLAVLGRRDFLGNFDSKQLLEKDNVLFLPLEDLPQNYSGSELIEGVVCFLDNERDLVLLSQTDLLKNSSLVLVCKGDVSLLEKQLEQLEIKGKNVSVYMAGDKESDASILINFVDTFLRRDLIDLDMSNFVSMISRGDYLLSRRIFVSRDEKEVEKALKKLFKEMIGYLESKHLNSITLKFLGDNSLTLDNVYSVAEIIRNKYFYVDSWQLGVAVKDNFSGWELVVFFSLREVNENGKEERILPIFDV